jgi:hypothetical protein
MKLQYDGTQVTDAASCLAGKGLNSDQGSEKLGQYS